MLCQYDPLEFDRLRFVDLILAFVLGSVRQQFEAMGDESIAMAHRCEIVFCVGDGAGQKTFRSWV